MLAFEGVTTVSEGNKAREVGSLTSCEVGLIIYRVVPMWSWYQLKKNLQDDEIKMDLMYANCN